MKAHEKCMTDTFRNDVDDDEDEENDVDDELEAGCHFP